MSELLQARRRLVGKRDTEPQTYTTQRQKTEDREEGFARRLELGGVWSFDLPPRGTEEGSCT